MAQTRPCRKMAQNRVFSCLSPKPAFSARAPMGPKSQKGPKITFFHTFRGPPWRPQKWPKMAKNRPKMAKKPEMTPPGTPPEQALQKRQKRPFLGVWDLSDFLYGEGIQSAKSGFWHRSIVYLRTAGSGPKKACF